MNRCLRSRFAFSLVEVTLALGVAAFCLMAVFGLMPVGQQTNRNATSQTQATNIINVVVAALRTAPKTPGTWTGMSAAQLCITLGTPTTLYCDGDARCSSLLNGSTTPCPGSWPTPIQTRYRVSLTFPQFNFLTYVNVKVTWPAAADPSTTTPNGSVEMLAALDRR